MADIDVPLEAFRTGMLPEVCVRTGTLAANRYRMVAKSASGPIAGAVPVSRAGVRQLQLVRLGGLGLLSASLLCLLAALATSSAAVAVLGLVLLAGAVGVVGYAARTNVTARVDGTVVHLQNVHSGFVNAMKQPPSKCSDCSNAGSCSVADMAACETDDTEHVHTH